MSRVEIPSYLENYQAVCSAFGGWPSFHDAPILRLKRTADTSVELLLHGWNMLPEVDDKGYFKSAAHHLVCFEFHGTRWPDEMRYRMSADRYGNGLRFMGWSPLQEWQATGEFKVVLDSFMGGDFDTELWAKSGCVAEVVPCDAKGNPLL